MDTYPYNHGWSFLWFSKQFCKTKKQRSRRRKITSQLSLYHAVFLQLVFLFRPLWLRFDFSNILQVFIVHFPRTIRGFGGAIIRASVLPLRSLVRFSLRTHVKRVSQRSAESRGFAPGAQFFSRRESWQGGLGLNTSKKVISQLS
jgi:hypothetical protein